mgnify:FL=1
MIVAVDTGGTKTLVAVFDTEGKVVAEEKFPTPEDIAEYIATLSTTIDKLMDGQAITCLSVALPGTIVDGRMVWAGNLPWRDIDVRSLLGSHFDCPIIVENDANLAGLAEARALETVPDLCLCVAVGTGIGTGVTVKGRIDPVLSRTEGGRIMLERDGAYQIWESFASGKAIHERYGKLASEIEDTETWNAIASDFAKGLLALTPFLRPDIVVFGGGVGAYLDRFIDPLMDILRAYLHDDYVPTIVKASHLEKAVIYGCYYHALDSVAA